ncbi:MAG: 3-keto-5-aminohexanoate cleavage protein [Devosiaceae bacterium]|nr:3-keto-5-aminohexanoate cleavage protein [Devosiaceae bacterium]
MNSNKRQPQIFVAPNGARKSKQDHPSLPMTIDEIVTTAKTCFEAGATGLHAHVRDEKGKHILDAGLYGELIGEMELKVPAMGVQITTEAVGIYNPAEQRELVRAIRPKMVSVSMAEMFEDDDLAAVSRFYYWAKEENIEIQHIVYSAEEFLLLSRKMLLGTIPARQKSVLFVLGRYEKNQQSNPAMLQPFLDVLKSLRQGDEWRFMVCAFGRGETDCLVAAAKAKGDCRVGFENNFLHRDGVIARDNADRVLALKQALEE